MVPAFVAAICRQVLLGVGIAAGQALVETGQQLTVQTIQSKLAEWNINIDPDSPLGLLFDNFKSNVGFQMTSELMSFTNTYIDSQLDSLNVQALANRQAIRDEAFGMVEKSWVKGVGNYLNKKLFNNNNATITEADMARAQADKMCTQSLNEVNSDLLRVKGLAVNQISAVGTRAGHFSTSFGVNNSGFAAMTNFTDDTKFFDAVQYLINMKKVG